MAELRVVGHLRKIEEKQGGYLSISVAEPDYKDKDGNYVTPWFNFLLRPTTAGGKNNPLVERLKKVGSKFDVVEIVANERQGKKDNTTVYYHNVISITPITWKKGNSQNASQDGSSNASPSDSSAFDDDLAEAEEYEAAMQSSSDPYPWENQL